ncbi:hypothetical protein WNZ15_16725 [Roseibium sp. AS2]|uniref:hypothetical protein n=1 Tax=Roseibium sp. AS2 TaxID=3135781 RepID=UPI003173B676
MQLSKITATMMALGLFGAGIGQSAAVTAVPLAASSINAAAPDTTSVHSGFVQIAERKREVHKHNNHNNKIKNNNVNNTKIDRNINNKNVNRNVNNKTVNRNVNNTTVNRNVNVNVVNRPRGWHGQYWGAAVFGVTLGTLIVVAANTPPPAPDPTLCWTWSNSAMTEGYWYYCTGG